MICVEHLNDKKRSQFIIDLKYFLLMDKVMCHDQVGMGEITREGVLSNLFPGF